MAIVLCAVMVIALHCFFDTPAESCMCEVGVPGSFVAPLAWLLQPNVSMGVALVANRPSGVVDVLLGVASLLLTTAALGYIALVTTLHFEATTVPFGTRSNNEAKDSGSVEGTEMAHNSNQSFDSANEGNALRCLAWLFWRKHEWADKPGCGGFVARYGLLFEAYRGQRQWFVNVELWVNAVIAVLVGLIPPSGSDEEGRCAMLLYGCVAVNVAVSVLQALLRPHMSRVESLLAAVQHALSLAWSVLAVIQNDAAQRGASFVSQTQAWASALFLILALVQLPFSLRIKSLVKSIMRAILAFRRKKAAVSEKSAGVVGGSLTEGLSGSESKCHSGREDGTSVTIQCLIPLLEGVDAQQSVLPWAPPGTECDHESVTSRLRQEQQSRNNHWVRTRRTQFAALLERNNNTGSGETVFTPPMSFKERGERLFILLSHMLHPEQCEQAGPN